jgi:hypothetical protein
MATVLARNPSLLEAMAEWYYHSIADNDFNRTMLQNDAFYFKAAAEVEQLCNQWNILTTAIMVEKKFGKNKGTI